MTGGGRIGTWSYWAPEQLAQQPYDFAVDMWSVGVLMYILLVGFHPFDPDGEAEEQQILANMKAGYVSFDMPEWQGVSPQERPLISPPRASFLTYSMPSPRLLGPFSALQCSSAMVLVHRCACPLQPDSCARAVVQAKQLVQSLLKPLPNERCTAAELVSHPWVLGEDVPSKPLPATQERLRAFIKVCPS